MKSCFGVKIMKSKSNDVCSIDSIDEEKVANVRGQLGTVHMKDVAQMFKALADDTRIKIAKALTIEEELCVHDIANVVGCTTATASHHLRLLRNLGLAKYRKHGKYVYYSLDDHCIKQLIDIAFNHQKEVAERE